MFEEIYEQYWQKIFRLCMSYVNDQALAKDLAQETFLVVLKKLPQFRNESSVGTWIFRIASNICLRQIERRKRFPKDELPLHLSEEKESNLQPEISFLYQSISELPETDRIIIALELEDINQEEIASIVGLSNANVRVKIHRIKKELRKKFERYEG